MNRKLETIISSKGILFRGGKQEREEGKHK
jgi:hypothetical protein